VSTGVGFLLVAFRRAIERRGDDVRTRTIALWDRNRRW